MTVRELIDKLLDLPMNEPIEVRTLDHFDENGIRISIFNTFPIDGIDNSGVPDGAIHIDFTDSSRVKSKENIEPEYPNIIGCPTSMFVDGKWIIGKIIEGYRFGDGIVTIEDKNGDKYWCGQDRTDIYHRISEEEYNSEQ